MPQEIGYRQQVQGASPARLPDASPAAFGASVGAGAAQLGGSLQNAELRSRQIERKISADQAWSDFSTRFADTRGAIDRARIDARINAAPGGAGHTQAMEQTFDAATQGLADGLVESEQRNRAREMIASYRGQIVDEAYGWETGKRVEKMVTDNRSAIDKATARIFTSGDPKSYAQETQALVDSVSGLTGVPADVREKLLKEGNEKLAIAYGNHLIDSNPTLAKAAIDAGVFNDVLDGQQLDRLSNGAHAQIRANEAQARAQAAAEAAAVKEDLAAQAVTLNAGGGTYQDRLSMAQRYDALGDKSKAAEWQGKAQQFAVVQGSKDWTPAQLDARIAALQGKQGGAGLSGPEAQELAGLTDQRTATTQRLRQDGGALLQLQYATGRVLAPLDPADPASLRQRGRDAIVAAQRYGRNTIEPILPNELQAFKDLADKGPNGKLQVLDALRGFGDAQTIAGAVRQVAGDDGAMRVAAQLPRDVARDVLRGPETLKAHPQVWKQAQATADFAKWYGNALSWLGGSYRNDVFDAAKGFYAQRASDGGLQQYDPGHFSQAVRTVLGQKSDGRGGVAETSQGIVLVPSTIRPKQLLDTFARAKPEDYSKATGGRHPVWSDGKRMTEPEFKSLLPTMIADGVYGFRGRNGQLVHDDKGDRYAVPVSALPAR